MSESIKPYSILYIMTVILFIICCGSCQESDTKETSNRLRGTIFDKSDSECIEDIPILSVGKYLDDSEEAKKEHKAFILSVSDYNCTDCCTSETMLFRLSELMEDSTVHYKNDSIPIYRVDVNKSKELLESEGIILNRVPKTFMFFKGEFYPFEEVDDVNLLKNFIERVITPVVILKTKIDVDRFRESFDDSYSKSTRVIALVSSKSEYKHELKELTNAARSLAHREDLRVAKLVNSRIVKEIKRKHKTWFSDVSSNTVVSFMQNRDSEQVFTHSYDLAVDDEEFVSWINHISVAPLEELTVASLKIMAHKPIFTAYVNIKHPKYGDDSKELLKNLKDVASSYPQFYMTYTEDPIYKSAKEEAGIDFSEEPALALNPLQNEGKPIVFPRRQPFTKKNLKYFFKKISEGTFFDDDFRLPDLVRNFDHNMKDATKLTLENYSEFLSQDADKYVLMFESTGTYPKIRELTKFFGKTATRFKELELDHIVKLGFFDISLQDLPDDLSKDKSIPLLRFFPKGGEALDPVSPERTGVQQMMKYVQKHSHSEFKLPAFPHFSPHEYSQSAHESKITYQEVVDAEKKKKHADKVFEDL